MYSHTDLLSYDDIDNDVERIFRAYCDTSLIEFAESTRRVTRDGKKGEPEPGAYWRKVVVFRRANLSSHDRPDLLRRAVGLDDDTKRIDDADSKFSVGFLYWFDVRAEYWAYGAADPELVGAIAPSKRLRSLYQQAQIVQQRIREAQEISMARDSAGWKNGARSSFLAGAVAESLVVVSTGSGMKQESDE